MRLPATCITKILYLLLIACSNWQQHQSTAGLLEWDRLAEVVHSHATHDRPCQNKFIFITTTQIGTWNVHTYVYCLGESLNSSSVHRCWCGLGKTAHGSAASAIPPTPGEIWVPAKHTQPAPTDAYGTVEFQGGPHPTKAQVRLLIPSSLTWRDRPATLQMVLFASS